MVDTPKYDQLCAAVKKVGGEAESMDEMVLNVADIISTIFDDATGGVLGLANDTGQLLYSILKASKKGGKPPIPNPWFVMNGHEDRPNKYSVSYLEGRKWKSIGGSAFSIAGTLASSHTAGINVADIISHGNALTSTGIHLAKLIAIADDKKFRKSETIQGWLRIIMAMKMMKMGVRTTGLIGGVVPGASIPAGIASIVAKKGIKLSMNNVCLTTAAAIHWRAYQEQQLSGSNRFGGVLGRNVGPASRIYWEIFTRRTATFLFGGRYEIAQLVNEPCGWLALHDKLMLI